VENIPDMNSISDFHEAERDRWERKQQRQELENIDPKDLPFYQDPQTYIELGGKKPWKKEQL